MALIIFVFIPIRLTCLVWGQNFFITQRLKPRIQLFLVFLCLTALAIAQAETYSPLVYRVAGIPPGTGKVLWATDGLAGTADGVYQRQSDRWRQFLPGREILALGEMAPGAWWAAGAGFVAFSSGTKLTPEEEFYGGCWSEEGLFLAGKQGVWLWRNNRLKLVHPLTSPERLRLFLLNGRVWLYAHAGSYAWTQGRFVSESLWPGTTFRDVHTVRPAASGYHVLAFEGLYAMNGPVLSPLYAEAFRDLYPRGTVGFYVGDNYAVLASVFDGVRAVSAQGQLLWQLGIQELGGNPFSLVKTPEGFLVGTSSGAVTLFSDAIYLLPLPGENIQSVGSMVHLLSGTYALQTGKFTPNAPLAQSNGASGTWGAVTLPGGKIVKLEGREVLAILAYQDGWVVLQDAVLTHLDSAGVVRTRWPLVGADSAVVDGDLVWVGSAIGLLRFDGSSLTFRDKGHQVRVEQGEASPVFVSENSLSFPRATSVLLPGRIRAVSGRYAAIQVGVNFFVGQYNSGRWQPLDIPALPADLSHLRVEGDLLYLVSPHSVWRIQLSKTGLLTPRPSRVHTVTVVNADYTYDLPAARPAPWPSPRFSAKANGVVMPVVDGAIVMPRLPYGLTEIAITESIGGLQSIERITLERNRPWWLNWPGAGLGLLAVVTAVWMLVRWRTRRLSRQARQLQRLVDEKTMALGEALQAREFFFSSVSHEIRNPLNGVVGLCDMLNESSVGARERLLVKTLKSCSDQLRHILDDVLDFSRIDRGEMEFHPETFDLVSAVEGAARAVDPTLERVQLLVADSVWVEGDVGKLRQVVTNLVSNALKYGQPPMAQVEVNHTVENGYIVLQVKVSNSGPDLSVGEQASLFQGFQRGESAKRRRLPGEGLGLALSQRIMRAMQGNLTVQSRDGLTSFSLSVTLRPGTPATESGAAQLPAHSSKALAIEDEHYNRLVLGHLLGQMGYRVDWAVDGASALAAVKTGNYDLILTDFMLPDMDGVALTKALLAVIAVPPPPVVMVTAYSTREKQEAAYAAGASGFVTKPVTLKKLQAALLGLGFGLRGRRSLDVVRAPGRFDFVVFHRMNEGRVALGQFAAAFEADFRALLDLVNEPDALRKAAHALRGRALVIHATALAEQLGALEAVAANADRDQVARVLSVIEPMVQDLAGSARHHVFSSTDFGKTLREGVTH